MTIIVTILEENKKSELCLSLIKSVYVFCNALFTIGKTIHNNSLIIYVRRMVHDRWPQNLKSFILQQHWQNLVGWRQFVYLYRIDILQDCHTSQVADNFTSDLYHRTTHWQPLENWKLSYKPWKTKLFFSILNHQKCLSSFRFIWITMLWFDSHYKFCYFCSAESIQASKVDLRALRVKHNGYSEINP